MGWTTKRAFVCDRCKTETKDSGFGNVHKVVFTGGGCVSESLLCRDCSESVIAAIAGHRTVQVSVGGLRARALRWALSKGGER